MYKILIVEDDRTIAQSLKRHLEKWDYTVCTVRDFHNVMEEFVSFGPELVLMDILLPFYNGYHWCTEIRKNSSVPILFLSSASDNMNIVMAMNMGGDDFIEKPFDLNVLTAKIQAILRRAYSFQGQANLLERGGAFLNLSDATLTYQEEKIELTKNDFKILKVLMENAGKIVEREELMQRLWESDTFIDDNTLTVNVTRIRRKLEEIGLYEFIKTKKGIGYLIE
ncbi:MULTISPECIES: response regulator transcription factor [Lachnospiraceae]|uniref:Stage 0 sporulation protein A homolog n=1 Tax=Faecalicatena acetigenes TaxID=2981790 RepID=A0ABT2TG20_9FIRM|nr:MULTISPECIES: response regulator transcription factor [Lachnospiraceae]MCU6748614.1 response regulator transcription factor [Faecalicatena acetigenes]SCI54442.1 Glycopeptide resistance-associated protein R [uncultured Clostridium sp.]